jgi:hypothetical protein
MHKHKHIIFIESLLIYSTYLKLGISEPGLCSNQKGITVTIMPTCKHLITSIDWNVVTSASNSSSPKLYCIFKFFSY